MGNALAVQNQFGAGEWSPYAQGRFDQPTYRAALKVCLNAFPIETAAWTRRPGTQFARATVNGMSARKIKFDFSEATPYTCEFAANGTNGYLSFRVGTKLVTTNDDQVISSISAATPAVVQTAGAHGWSTGNIVFAHGLGVGVPVLQERQFSITVIDTTHFSLADAITGDAINGAALGAAFISGFVSRRLILASPYNTVASLPTIRLVQTDGSPNINSGLPFAVLFNAGVNPYLLSVTQAQSGSAFAEFSLQQMGNFADAEPHAFQDGPYLDPPPLGNHMFASALSGNITLTASSGVFSSDSVGRLIRIFSQPPPWSAVAGTYAAGDIVSLIPGNDPSQATYWRCQVANSDNFPGGNAVDWGVAASPAAIWTWGLITAVSGDVASVTIMGDPLVGENSLTDAANSPILLWRFGVYSGSTGWPTCGTYHEGRLWMSGAVPNRIDGCQSNQILPLLMGPTEIDGTVTDSDAVSYVFNAPDANPIFWLEPDLQGIICGTQAGEWLVQATAQNEPLTPTSAQAHRNTTVGCANVEPARCELTLAFVQKYQRRVMEYFADVFSGKLTAPNLSEYAMHLGVNSFEEIRFQHSVNPLIWARDGVGNLVGATYRRTALFSSQKPDFIGWHRHALGSGYTVQSLAVGPSVGGELDALTLVTQDPNGVNYVEVLTDAFDEDETLANAVFLDQATKPTSSVVNAATSPDPFGSVTFNGLWHFNGKTVTVWAAGFDCGDYAVVNGSMTVPFGDGLLGGTAYGQFTAAAWAASGVAWIGYNYNSDGEGLPPVDPREAGTQAGIAFAKVQRGQQFGARLVNAGPGGQYGGIYFGGSFATLRKAAFKSSGGTVPLAQSQMFSGVYWDTFEDAYSLESTVCWRIDRPYPCTLTAIGEFIHTQDR